MDIVFILSAIFLAEAVMTLFMLLFSSVFRICGMSFGKAFRKSSFLLLLPPVLFLYGFFVERHKVEVKKTDAVFSDLPEAFDGYRIVQISDLHLHSFRNMRGLPSASRQRSLQDIVSRINALNADAVMFTGDLVTFGPDELDGFEEILAGIEAEDGVFSVLGNHDYCIYNAGWTGAQKDSSVALLVRREKAMGWKPLMNESRVIYESGASGKLDSITVAGVENISASAHFPSRGDLDKALAGVKGFCILLSHDPSHWRLAVEGNTDVDLMLSGHTHAMQLSIIGLSPSRILFREYRGMYMNKKGDQALYVNIGLGETLIPSRIGTCPEITLITLKRPN